jgi:hypothetical protein
MGITNFCKLLKLSHSPSETPDPFDSILVDAQSFLYVAIDNALHLKDEESMITEICQHVWNLIHHHLNLLLSFRSSVCREKVTLVLSFDGPGVPMKWATQRKRRDNKKGPFSTKFFYKNVLFGTNRITLRVQEYVLKRLKKYHFSDATDGLNVALCGCDVLGEGEHKMFQVAEVMKCRNPIILSVDQDVFVLAFLRLDRYDTIQIYRYKEFYRVTHMARSEMQYPLKLLVTVSSLFGNDFVPPLLEISDANVSVVNYRLSELDTDGDDPSATLSHFLNDMSPKLRYTVASHVDRELIINFWLTYIWIFDYYVKRHFPQLYMENKVFDAFDRNQLLTALMDEEYSRELYREAKARYDKMTTQPISDAERHVFGDSEILDKLKPYWINPSKNACTLLYMRKKGKNVAKPV